MNGPLSPEEIAAQASYWGGAGMSSPAVPPPAGDPGAYYGPPPPIADAGPMYDYSSGAPPEAPPPPPPAPIRPVGAQLSQVGDPQTGGFQAPVAATPPAPGPSAMPPMARGPAPSDLETPAAGAPSSASAAAAAALAHYGGAGGGPSARPAGGGGGGPRGLSDYEKGSKALRGTYDEDKGAMQRGATAEEDRSALIASGAQDIARQKQDDEMMQRLEAANAAKTFGDYQAETQRQIDDVRSKTINPNRAYSDTGSAVAAVIGGLLGGIYQGINKLDKNPFIEQMNKTIDRDVAAQETDLRTKKESIGERKGLLSDMRATYKDEALAKIQARNLYYEAAKEELMARASEYDSPAIQARADQAITALTREQTKLDINEAIRKAAAAQAAGAAAEHRRQQDFENQLKLQHARNETTTANAAAGKELASVGKDDVQRFVATGKDADGNPTGYLGRNPEEGKEREAARIAAKSLVDQIDKVQAIRREQGGAGRFASEAAHGIYDTKASNELAVLESHMTTTAAQAAHLGALSESDRGLMTAKFRNLNSVGGGADERLSALRDIVESALKVEEQQAAGARATKVVGPDGRERIVVAGTSNAPNNMKAVPREPVK